MSRKRRHRPNAGRALPPRDADELRALARSRPSEAAAAIARARRGEGALRASPEELDQLTAFVAGALRGARRFDEARALAASAASRSTPAALEEALAAFSAGDDSYVQEIASRAPALSPILEPLLAAARGSEPPKKPRGASRAISDLYAAARAVSASASGDLAAVKRATKAISNVESGARLIAACRLALAAPSPIDDAATLRANADSELAWLVRVAEAKRAPRRALSTRGSEDVAHHAVAALAPSLGVHERIELAVEHVGPRAFDRPGDALVWLGFLRLDAGDEARALHAFERALEAGADLIECLRGRWLAARRRLRQGGYSDSRELASAADALIRALARDPRHAAARVAVQVDLAEALTSKAGPSERVAAYLRQARAEISGSWTDTPRMSATVDLADAAASFARGDDTGGNGLLARAIASDPRDVDLWVDALTRAPASEIERLRAAAHEATEDERFGPTGVHGSLTAGALAEELTLARESDVADALQSLRAKAEGLPAVGRTHLDVGVLHILERRGLLAHAEAHLESRLATATGSHLEALLLTAIDLEMESALRSYFGSATLSDHIETLMKVVVCARVSVSGRLAGVLLGRLAPRLSRTQLGQIERMGKSLDAHALLGRVFEAAHDALHPEICLEAIGDEELGDALGPLDGDRIPGELLDNDDFVDATFRMFIEQMGLPPAMVKQIPRAQKRRILEGALDPSVQGNTKKAERFFTEMLGPALDPRVFGASGSARGGKKGKRRKRRKGR